MIRRQVVQTNVTAAQTAVVHGPATEKSLLQKWKVVHAIRFPRFVVLTSLKPEPHKSWLFAASIIAIRSQRLSSVGRARRARGSGEVFRALCRERPGRADWTMEREVAGPCLTQTEFAETVCD